MRPGEKIRPPRQFPGLNDSWRYAAVFLAALAVYLFTAAPQFLFDDNSEFIAAAHSLGITHAPGYPLFSLFGKLFFLLIPVGTGLAVNLVSVFAAAAAVALAYKLIEKITRWWVPALVGAVLVCVGATAWGQAVQAEVYALNLFFMFLMLNITWDIKGARGDARKLTALAAVAVLGMLAHYTTALVAVVCLIYILVVYGRKFPGLLRLVLPVLFAGLAVASILVYLPLRSAAGPPIYWHDQSTITGMLNHLRGVDTRSEAQTVGLAEKIKFVADYARLAVRQWSPFLLLLLIPGVAGLFFRGRRRGLLLLLLWLTLTGGFIMILNFLYGPRASYVISVFHIASLSLVAVMMGLGSDVLLRGIRSMKLPWQPVLLIIAVLIAYSGLESRKTADKSRNLLTPAYAKNMLRNVARDGMIFTNLETESFPLVCLRLVYGVRQDVMLFGHQGDRPEEVYPQIARDENTGRFHRLDMSEDIAIKHTRYRRPLYFTFRQPFSRTGVITQSNGLLYQVNPLVSKIAKHNPWDNIDLTGIDLERGDYDYITKNVVGKYYLRQGERMLEEGRGEQALQLLDRLSDFNPESRFLHNDIASIYMAVGQFDRARMEYEKALATDPENVELSVDTIAIYNNLSYVYGHLGMQDKALETMKKVVELDPDTPLLRVNLGQTYWHMDNCMEAVKQLEKAVELGAESASVHNILGICYEKLRSYPDAERNYKKALELNPDYAEVHKDYGIYNAYTADRPQRAISLLTRYLELAPEAEDAGQVHANLGFLLQKLGRHFKAIKHFNDAVALGMADTPRRLAIIKSAMAFSYDSADQLDEAQAAYERALDGAEAYPYVYRDFAMFLLRRKIDNARAAALLEKYIAALPNAPDRKNVEKTISRLNSSQSAPDNRRTQKEVRR